MAIEHIARLDAAIKAAGVAIESVNSDGIVSPASLQAAAQPTINAFDDSVAAQAAFENVRARARAGAIIDTDRTPNTKLLRAVGAVLVDELNLHADKINAILTAVDTATTLAQLKNLVAAIPDYPQRTLAQTVTAIKNKINAGTVD